MRWLEYPQLEYSSSDARDAIGGLIETRGRCGWYRGSFSYGEDWFWLGSGWLADSPILRDYNRRSAVTVASRPAAISRRSSRFVGVGASTARGRGLPMKPSEPRRLKSGGTSGACVYLLGNLCALCVLPALVQGKRRRCTRFPSPGGRSLSTGHDWRSNWRDRLSVTRRSGAARLGFFKRSS